MIRTTTGATRPTEPTWQQLTGEQKRERLRELRRHQHRDIASEIRLLNHPR